MKAINYRPLYLSKINKLGKIPQEKYKAPADLHKMLGDLFPEKAPSLGALNHSRITVSFTGSSPIVLDNRIALEYFFKDFPETLIKIREFFSLEGIILQGIKDPYLKENLKEPFLSFSKRIDKRYPFFDLYDFYRLSLAVQEGKLEKGSLVYIVQGIDKAFCFHLSQGTILKDLLAELSIEKNVAAYNPYTRETLDPDGNLLDSSTPVFFLGDDYLLKPAGEVLFPFPSFNRQVSVVRNKKSVSEETEVKILPCSNCLACHNYCPAGLYPSYLYHLIKGDRGEDASALGLEKCFSCGLCSFVCPSNIPLTQVLKAALNGQK